MRIEREQPGLGPTEHISTGFPKFCVRGILDKLIGDIL